MDLDKAKQYLNEFVGKRNWEKFHSPKNLAMSIAIESAELLEHFHWIREEDTFNLIDNPAKMEEIRDEMGDIISGLIQLAAIMDIDLEKAFWDKLEKTAQKYPIPSSHA